MPNCSIHCELAAKLNFAAHQNAVPVLRELRVENHHKEERLEGLSLRLRADPDFVSAKEWTLDRIEPQGSLSISDRDLEVSGDFLRNATEAVRGHVELRLEKDGKTLAELRKPVELLAYNQWGGSSFMPELLAAFSTPNDPAIDKVLRNASEILRQAGRPDHLDGYMSLSRQRIWEMASAIYAAIANLSLAYALPPKSFEREGQKVRLPSHILEGRIGTCLDTAMLFASAFEQAGLHPVVALPQGHALTGVWLQPMSLSSVVIDEAEVLRKRIDSGELALIETTCVTAQQSFSEALEAAQHSIRHEDDVTFAAALDIHQARAHRIAPLGLQREGSAPGDEPSFEIVQQALEEAPTDLPDYDIAETAADIPETPAGRLERWQRKLLDLSLRNPLLNHRASRTNLELICPEPNLLEDILADNAPISITPLPGRAEEGRDEALHQQRTGESISEEYAREQLKNKVVFVDLPREELHERTVKLYRKAQTALQEGGANTLYLALGFLRWKRNERDNNHLAPLILLPVALERRFVGTGGVKLTAYDDEPRFNTTLLQMLRTDFGIDIRGLEGELPRDESGIDVQRVWNAVKKEIRETQGFEVVPAVALSHFSFAKHLMWKDLVDRTEQLRENEVVNHLLDNSGAPYAGKTASINPERLDRDYRPVDLLLPLPADSSQMAAVATAGQGNNFIIIGPPGTGKSQTIANLVAHSLGKGKTVLFASEKTAALEVVRQRLQDLGLGHFCLELHSNKARKADVIEHLKRAWEQTATPPADWQRQGRELATTRDKLNRLVERMHKERGNGLSAYEAIGVKVRDGDLARRVSLSWPAVEQHDEAALDAMRAAVRNLAIHAKEVGDVASKPLRLITNSAWTPRWETQISQQASQLSTTAQIARKTCAALLRAMGLVLPSVSATRLMALSELAQLIHGQHPIADALGPNGATQIEALKEAGKRLRIYQANQRLLSCDYEPYAWRDIDGKALGQHWEAAATAWWPKSFFAKRGIVKALRAQGALGKPAPKRDAETLARMRAQGEAIDRLAERLSDVEIWKGHETKPEDVETRAELGQRARAAVADLADRGQAREILDRVHLLLRNPNNPALAPGGNIERATAEFLETFNALQQTIAEFGTLARDNELEQTDGDLSELADTWLWNEPAFLEQLGAAANLIATHRHQLQAWCAWRQRRKEVIDAGLAPLVEAIENGQIPLNEIEETFWAAYCVWWSEAVITEDATLRAFSKPEHEANIRDFRELDDKHQEATAQHIAATLAGRLPAPNDVLNDPQWQVIRRELQKQRRHLPIRRLLKEAPEAVIKLSPCFMMSPLSIAQYLPPDQKLFDVVIFDEASQIPVWDAVGSIARGRQVIIAGDNKQMPPTNFFARADDDPDGDFDVIEDLESILDEMLASGIPRHDLNFHYRSRREDLIAFSNQHYYDNRLITFPAPDAAKRGVSLVRPEGFYARGGARHNEGEAKAIVAEIVRRLTHKDDNIRKLSIGVVTFNTEQQTLIEDLLDKARGEDPSMEWAFNNEYGVDPVFVKNLETVQGDERDVILFSVTYGPDRSGHTTMNFGPLNRQGGERRLNVAMTRARAEMMVFSTLDPNQIDLSRTSARAVADLKHFLEYAERGPAVLGALPTGSLGDFESPFEAAVARELRIKGWEVQPQIGVSKFRIDLGIKHPDEPGRYLAGVECDGAMYHSSAVAKERDKVRQAALERLGWTLFRVWSTSWWVNKPGEINDLHEKLNAHLEKDLLQRSSRGEM